MERRDDGGWTLTINRQGRELLGGARELQVLWASGGREGRGLVDSRLRGGQDLGAVDQVAGVVAENGELGERGLEARRHELLLVDEALPEACRARVMGERKVGLETHLARIVAAVLRKRGRNLAGVVVASREADTLEQDLEEDLGVEHERRLQKLISEIS